MIHIAVLLEQTVRAASYCRARTSLPTLSFLKRASFPQHRLVKNFISAAAMYSNGKSKPSDVPEYCLIEDVESLWRYTSGGYHPVMIGDVLHKRYEVLDKLGYGGWSTTWLVRDTQLERNVALKIGISDSSRHETAILRALAAVDDTSEGSKLIAVPLDEFEIEGPNGTHPCYTMAVAEGNLGDASLHDLFPLEALRCLAAGLTLAVAHVHSRGFVHGGE